MPPSGFGGLSRRAGKKPVLAAVNGLCFGGGFEMIINADMVLADEKATFGLPEVKRGVVAIAGALPRLVRVVGKQRAGELALIGGVKGAREMAVWGVVNKVIEGDVVEEAVRWLRLCAGTVQTRWWSRRMALHSGGRDWERRMRVACWRSGRSGED